MKQTKLNRDWTFMAGEVNMMASMMGITQETSQVDLPHDAMILEERKPDTGNGGHTGFYPSGVYTYIKPLDVPMEWQDKDIYLEFEGVFANAQVYVNDDLVAQRPYGYSEFHAMLNDYLIYGQQNEIKVICNTQVEHQSRWYTGSGIYRDVNLYVSDPLHVSLHGLKIVTEDVEPESAVVEINLNIENNSRIMRESLILIELMDKYDNVVKSVKTPLTMRSHSTTNLRKRLVINNPLLWSCDTPDLYSCYVQIIEGNTVIDETESAFGIRKIQLDAVHGLRINGARSKLRGACIHHDNGVVGAAAFARAEVRRVEQLKEAGFNCVRSSHNPAGRALLDACDRVGMLMMDETFDVWMKCKTQNDYANFFMDWWERDVEAMVLKDL
ncbi:MAG: glycoside hydrolase family 2 TIM barrel-domain containing protein, partial [Eubacteriales bacterium]|nr:glycoside hydrolase family 2 TIM barrel-domain containing protein [Eubacteriales bacterium]